MKEHVHYFGGYRGPRHVAFCQADPECTEVRVGDRRGVWRELNVDEQLALTAHMMEATAIARAMMIIHGQERGIQRARQALGYDG